MPPLKNRNARSHRFRVGQRWRFTGRSIDPDPMLTIVAVESDPALGLLIHVGIEGVRILSPHSPRGFSDALPHAPFTADAIDRSVTVLLASDEPLPAFEEGYQRWKEAGGGVFSISVREVLDLTEAAFQ